jgi:hypothetical protein
MINRPPPIETLQALIAAITPLKEIDLLTAAHLTAALVAPKGSYVAVGPVSREVRVCLPKKGIGMPDRIWTDWEAWRARWTFGPLDAGFGMIDRNLPGCNYLFGRGRAHSQELPYACRLLFGMDHVLGQAEHDDGPVCVVLALLNALLLGQLQAKDEADAKGAH